MTPVEQKVREIIVSVLVKYGISTDNLISKTIFQKLKEAGVLKPDTNV